MLALFFGHCPRIIRWGEFIITHSIHPEPRHHQRCLLLTQLPADSTELAGLDSDSTRTRHVFRLSPPRRRPRPYPDLFPRIPSRRPVSGQRSRGPWPDCRLQPQLQHHRPPPKRARRGDLRGVHRQVSGRCMTFRRRRPPRRESVRANHQHPTSASFGNTTACTHRPSRLAPCRRPDRQHGPIALASVFAYRSEANRSSAADTKRNLTACRMFSSSRFVVLFPETPNTTTP